MFRHVWIADIQPCMLELQGAWTTGMKRGLVSSLTHDSHEFNMGVGVGVGGQWGRGMSLVTSVNKDLSWYLVFHSEISTWAHRHTVNRLHSTPQTKRMLRTAEPHPLLAVETEKCIPVVSGASWFWAMSEFSNCSAVNACSAPWDTCTGS